MMLSNPLTLSWNNQGRLSVGSSEVLSLCATAFIQTIGEKSFFGPLMPNHRNAEIMPLFSRSCHNWAVRLAPVLAFHLTTATRAPLWLITACLVFNQIILNPCLGVWPKEVKQGYVTLSLTVPQPNTFWDLFSDSVSIILGSKGETRKPSLLLGLSSNHQQEEEKWWESWYC